MQLTLEKVTLKRTGTVYYTVWVGSEMKIATDNLEKAQMNYDLLKKELEINPPVTKESEYLTEILQSENI